MKVTTILMKILFIIDIILLALSVLAGGLPAVICWIVRNIFIVLSIIVIPLASISFGIGAIHGIKSADIILIVVIPIITLITIFATKKPFILFHDYTEVERGLKKIENIPDFKIKGIYKKNDPDCDYIFNVEAQDENKTIFQAGYCDCGSECMWSSYNVIQNYTTGRTKLDSY